MRRRTVPISLVVAAVALVSLPAPAIHAERSVSPADFRRITVDDGLIGPLSIAVRRNGTVFTAQNFVGVITKVRPGHAPKDIYVEKGEVGALSVRKGILTFAVSKNNGRTFLRQKNGDSVTTLADLSAYEASSNPDADSEYGLVDIDAECEEQWPAQDFGPARYGGIVESHPYATWGDGTTTYVADAGANAVFAVEGGDVRTLAVLDPAGIEVTEELVAMFGLPECVTGLTYFSEPVPTDIEMGPDGNLHVTTLPGGPGEVVASGAVTGINPSSGAMTTEVEGLFTPVGLAITPHGDMYVNQLFSGEVAKIPAGSATPEVYRTANFPAALEYSVGRLYATVDTLSEEPPFGRLVTWTLEHHERPQAAARGR